MALQEVLIGMARETPQRSRSLLIGLTSFLFIVLQSVCTAVIALSSIRLMIGVGSLAAASSTLKLLDTIHGNSVRIPMMILAVGGSVINLYVVWRIRSLRGRSSSKWRAVSVPSAKRRAESIQIIIAVLTLLLVALEWIAHVRLFGSLFR